MGDNAYKQSHRELGLCTNCSRPAIPMKYKCAEHEHNHRIASKNYYWKNPEKQRESRRKNIRHRIDNRLCRTCGKDLDSDADEGHVICMNCRSIRYREELKCR